MEELKKNLDILWASRVLEYHFDMLTNKVSFHLETIDNGNIYKYEINFNRVSLFYFINDNTESRKNMYAPDEDDYLEFTSINILQDAEVILDSCRDNWIEQYKGKANICIEIWSKLILIEADSIELNSTVYLLNK